MVNIMRLSDELQRALRGRPFHVHYTDEQLANMRRVEARGKTISHMPIGKNDESEDHL